MCKPYVACNLLSQSDVSTALMGMTVAAGMEDDFTLGSLVTDGCDFTGMVSVTLNVSCAPDLTNGPDLYNSMNMAYGSHATPIMGLGQAAFWITGSPDAGNAGQEILVVYYGGHSNFALTIDSLMQTSLDLQSAATQMAHVVANHLMI